MQDSNQRQMTKDALPDETGAVNVVFGSLKHLKLDIPLL